MEWINVNDRLPELNKNVLILAKRDFYFPYIDDIDNRKQDIFVGYFYDYNTMFKNSKIRQIEFKIDCGCSGSDCDRERLDISHWMELPELPKE